MSMQAHTPRHPMAVSEKTYIGTIDITPSWSQIMPVLVDLAQSTNAQARDTAYAELTKMAKLADLYVAYTKRLGGLNDAIAKAEPTP